MFEIENKKYLGFRVSRLVNLLLCMTEQKRDNACVLHATQVTVYQFFENISFGSDHLLRIIVVF